MHVEFLETRQLLSVTDVGHSSENVMDHQAENMSDQIAVTRLVSHSSISQLSSPTRSIPAGGTSLLPDAQPADNFVLGGSASNTAALSVQVNDNQTLPFDNYVRLETPMALYDYPFDTQNLRAFMIPFGNMSEEVVIEVDDRYTETTESYSRRESTVNVAGWDFLNLNMNVDSTQIQLHETAPTFSRMVTTIVLKRQSWQIVWVLLFPLVMLVSMAWSTFWLDPDAISDRLNVSFVGILTIVAYQFVVIDNMPRNSYLTFTDILLLISFFITSLTIPHSLYVKSLTDRGKKMMAQRLDRICRWAFPLGYAAGIFLFLALYKLN